MNQTNHSPKTNLETQNLTTDKSHDYNRQIKQRLANWLDTLREHGFDVNFEQLAQKMSDDYGIPTTAQKLRPMFNIQSEREVKLPELAALAHIIQLPIGELCEFPNAPAINGLRAPYFYQQAKDKKEHGIRTLKNPYYFGKYHAYYFHPSRTDKLDRNGDFQVSGSEIDEAEICIVEKNGDPFVVLTEKTTRKDFYEERTLDNFVLEGKLYLIQNGRVAYSFISDAKAKRAYALMFQYRDFGKDILYYTTIGMMTFSINEVHQPLFQKMALFRVEQNLKDPVCNDILRGILALDTDVITIEQDVFDQEIEQNPYFGDKLQMLKANATLSKPCYQFSEQSIRQSAYPWSLAESTEVILKLKEMSLSSAHEWIHDQEYFRKFMKHYQQDQRKK